jgi:hypothetical protein
MCYHFCLCYHKRNQSLYWITIIIRSIEQMRGRSWMVSEITVTGQVTKKRTAVWHRSWRHWMKRILQSWQRHDMLKKPRQTCSCSAVDPTTSFLFVRSPRKKRNAISSARTWLRTCTMTTMMLILNNHLKGGKSIELKIMWIAWITFKRNRCAGIELNITKCTVCWGSTNNLVLCTLFSTKRVLWIKKN